MATLPPLRAIQIFEAVARCGGVAAAAADLGVSAGAVSQQLHKLEESLNVRLFERSGRSLTLTCWGDIYYANVSEAFVHLHSAKYSLQHALTKRGIVLSAMPSLARWLRPLLPQWLASHPGGHVRLVGTHSETMLKQQGIDFRLSYGVEMRNYNRYTELFVDSVVPVCSPDFLRSSPVKSAADILKGPLIAIDWGQENRPPPSWEDWAQSVGLPSCNIVSALAFSLSSAAIDMAVKGGGFVLGQIAMVAEDVRHGRLVIPFDHRVRMHESYFLAWERDALDRPFGAEFYNFILAAAKRQTDISSGRQRIEHNSKKT